MKLSKTEIALIYNKLTQKIVVKEHYTRKEKESSRTLFEYHLKNGTLNKEVLELAFAEYLADLQQEFEEIKNKATLKK